MESSDTVAKGMDETFLGGERKGGGSGKWAGAQEVVVGAVEVRGKRTPGRFVSSKSPTLPRPYVIPFNKGNVERDSQIRTDASQIYSGVPEAGYDHDIVSTAHGVQQDDVLPTLHLAFSNLKAWLQGTFHGAVRKGHLQAYLNEFAFRFNRRKNLHAAFQRVLGIGTTVAGPTYDGIYTGTWAHPHSGVRRSPSRSPSRRSAS